MVIPREICTNSTKWACFYHCSLLRPGTTAAPLKVDYFRSFLKANWGCCTVNYWNSLLYISAFFFYKIIDALSGSKFGSNHHVQSELFWRYQHQKRLSKRLIRKHPHIESQSNIFSLHRFRSIWPTDPAKRLLNETPYFIVVTVFINQTATKTEILISRKSRSGEEVLEKPATPAVRYKTLNNRKSVYISNKQ